MNVMDPSDILGNQEQLMQMLSDGNGGIDPAKDPFKDTHDWESDAESEDPDAKDHQKEDGKDNQEGDSKEIKKKMLPKERV